MERSPDELELTLRGFSPEEIRARAEKRCACYGLEVREAEIRPCMLTQGRRVLLYEGRFVASPAESPAA